LPFEVVDFAEVFLELDIHRRKFSGRRHSWFRVFPEQPKLRAHDDDGAVLELDALKTQPVDDAACFVSLVEELFDR
jgi:hypothetical protein